MRNLTEKGPDRCAILDNPDILGDCIDADGINEQRATFDKRLEYKEKKAVDTIQKRKGRNSCGYLRKIICERENSAWLYKGYINTNRAPCGTLLADIGALSDRYLCRARMN